MPAEGKVVFSVRGTLSSAELRKIERMSGLSIASTAERGRSFTKIYAPFKKKGELSTALYALGYPPR